MTPINESEYRAALASGWDIAGVVDGEYPLAVSRQSMLVPAG